MTRKRWRDRVGSSLIAVTVVGVLVGLEPLAGSAAPASLGQKSFDRYSIRWVSSSSDTNRVVIQVAGLETGTLRRLAELNWAPADWERLLAIHVRQGNRATEIELPAMLGTYTVGPRELRFEPAYPLDPGGNYRAMFYPDQLPGQTEVGTTPVVSDFQAPSRHPGPATVVRQVYPSAGVLPENLLKFYVQFSAPMSGGHIYEHLHLRNEAGKDIELPFLEIDEELWDPAMTRLTLLIDPGRIKRGVRPLEEVGPALEEGKSFTLVIDQDWRDAAGVPLKEAFRKSFKVGPPDREPPDPASWRIQPPRPGSTEPLTVVFPEPLDYALAQRVIRVTDASGTPVKGNVTLEDQEHRWSFRPERDWNRGPHTLSVQTTIEDLAGNNIGKLFEVDLFEGVQRRFTNTVVKLSFEVR